VSNTSDPTVRAHRHWGVAAVFALIAALPPIVFLALEAGTVARIRALLSGVKTFDPQPFLIRTEADTVAWAWAIFFGVLALIFATDTEPEVRAESEPEVGDDYVTAEPEAEVHMESAPKVSSDQAAAAPRTQVRAESKPSVVSGDNLPVVPNMTEVEAWYSRGNRLYGMGRYEEAIRCFDRALRIYPRFARAWAARGVASNALGQYQDAIHAYDESLRLDSRDPAVWHDKGNSLCAIGRLEGALSCFNEALILDPRDARAWNNKGICLASLGRPEEAAPCCDKALKIDPSYAVAWRAKGIIEERLGRIPDAVAAYKQFIALASAQDPASAESVQRHLQGLEASVQPTTESVRT
jgi:Flp pilus assembly protein TadD